MYTTRASSTPRLILNFWGRFLGEGQMDAFGAGTYTFVDTHLVQCDFGGRSHLLRFDEAMERFVSVRRGDLDVRRGERVSLEQ